MESKVYIDPYPKTMKMLGLERINIDCGNNTSIVTPANIAKDMVALLPDEVFIPESKFLDICCKSGIFLTSIREKLMNSKAMIEAIPDYKERYKYITNNQLYGIVPNGQCQMYSVRAVYGTLKVDNPHILCFGAFDQYKTACLNNNHKMLIDEMKKEFGQMKFDVVIGNPPYNNDIYLDFVTLGHTLASKYDCWITPAKWQAKGGAKNEQFRKEIVPYMNKIVYYKYSRDIFDIWEHDGISYYLMDKEKHSMKIITGKCSNKSFEWESYTSADYVLLSQIHKDVISKAMNNNISIEKNLQDYIRYSDLKYNGEVNRVNDNYIEMIGGNKVTGYIDINKLTTNYKLDKYKISNATMVGYWIAFDKTNNKTLGIVDYNIIKPYQVPKGSYPVIRYFDTEDEAISFKSYMKTKLVAFLFYCGIEANTINNSFYRYIPEQEAFDHIFTDEELYKKYNLTDEEINIIESVIKERK